MLITILIFAVVLVVLILSHEAGHAVVAWLLGCRVEEFGIGFPPKLFGKKVGETIFSINALPLGGFVRITGEDGDLNNGETANIKKDPKSFASKNPLIKLAILLAGVGMNILLAVVCYTLIAGIGADVPVEANNGGKPLQNQRVEIVGVEKNAVLTKSGILERDILEKINGETVSNAEDVVNKIKSFSGHELALTLKRGQETREVALVFDGNHEVGKPVGLSLLDVATYKVAWWQAPIEGVKSTVHVVKMTAVGIGGLFGDLILRREVPKDVAGPVGIASLVGSIGRQGVLPLMELIAVLSVNLALINILPIPALDGGRALFVLIESTGFRFLRGKPEQMAHTIGFALLILLVLLITINDIRRIIHP
jgi:regulator of sigma E protease